MAAKLDFEVFYYHMPRRAGVEEGDFHRESLRWSLPVESIALVLVDVWSDHYISTHLARGRKIAVERILPVLEMFRTIGAVVVHAPSPDCRWKYGDLSTPVGGGEGGGLARGDDRGRERGEPPPRITSSDRVEWPPEEFRKKTGPYESLGKPRHPEDRDFEEIIEKRSIVPEVEPRDGDCVIFDGAQLHGVLAERRVHTLLYAGFAANMCVPHRDYGMRAMGKRGYDVVLIEDCTTAIEVADTLEGMALTKAAIVDVAVSVGHTVSSGDLLAAAESARRRG